VVSCTPRPLYPQEKSPRYPLDRKLGGLQSRSGRGGEEKNSQNLMKHITTYTERLTAKLQKLSNKVTKLEMKQAQTYDFMS